MATVTQAVAATWTTTAGNKTSTAFTPAAGDLLVVIAPATGVATSSVTDNNADGLGAYTKIGSSFTGWSTSGDLSVWVRNSLVKSATSTTVTATQTSSTGGGLDVYRVSGMYRTAGIGAVRSSGGQSAGTAGTTPAPVLNLTPLTGNPVITAVCNGTSPGGVTQPASYTEPTNLGYSTPTAGLDAAFISSGITNATITWGSTSASAFGSVAIELDTSVPLGPVFRQATRAIRAPVPPQGYPQGRPGLVYGSTSPGGDSSFGSGRVSWSPGGPVSNPVSGPPLSWSGPAGIRAILVRTGLAMASPVPPAAAAPPPVPPSGPPFHPANQEIRAQVPYPFLKGRRWSSPGAPARNPSSGPPFRQKTAPARPVLPPPAPRAGRIGSSPGGPVRNPVQGPPAYAPLGPSRARLPWQPFLRGRVSSSPGVPFAGYLTLRFPAVPGIASPGAASPGVPFTGTAGPVFYPLHRPARAVIPPVFSKGRAAGSRGGPVQNPAPPPASGPPFRAASQPSRARLPWQPFLRGRVSFNAGAPVRNPSPGPRFFPFTQEVRAAFPQQPFLKGRGSGSQGGPVQNPSRGPVFRQATSPARIRPSLPPRGHAAWNPGGPVANPVPGIAGPPFYPLRWPARARIPQNAPRGRTSGNPGAPVRNPRPGAAFPAWRGPVQARQPLPPRGRTASNPGGPVQNPPPVVTGPVFRQATTPARTRPGLPPRGRAAWNPGGPVRNPVRGPAVPQAGQPVRARLPLPPRGRSASSAGAPPVTSGPKFTPSPQPVRAKFPLPPRGRTGSNPGIPAAVQPVQAGPKFTPRHDPARTRPSLPPRGRTVSGIGAPVRNPSAGPRFIQAVRPVRAAIPQNAPRGRTASNPGGPVTNIPVATLLFRLGSPYFQWDTGALGLDPEWSAGTPVSGWAAGVPETSA